MKMKGRVEEVERIGELFLNGENPFTELLIGETVDPMIAPTFETLRCIDGKSRQLWKCDIETIEELSVRAQTSPILKFRVFARMEDGEVYELKFLRTHCYAVSVRRRPKSDQNARDLIRAALLRHGHGPVEEVNKSGIRIEILLDGTHRRSV